MLLLLRLKDHDPPMFSDSAKRWTTNGASLYSFIRQVRQELCCSLEESVQNPGSAAHKAMQGFVSTITGWLTPEDHSVTHTLIAGLCYDPESAAAAEVDNLVCVAVEKYDQLEQVIAEIEETDTYERSLCDHDDNMEKPGFKIFDPATSGGRARLK